MIRFGSFCLMLLLSALPAAGLVEAGVASCDITPDVEAYRVPLAGYGARFGRPATGVHDRLHAKVLFFRAGDAAMALVTADLRSITPELKQQVLDRCGAIGLTRENLLMCASHTHAGPSIFPEPFWQFQFGKHDPQIVDIMSGRIAAALQEAAAAAAEVRIGFAKKRIEGYTRNRRWGYDTAAREAAGETPCVDPVLRVMRVDDIHGTPRAVLAHFASHPTIAGASNMQISAEWPGVLQARLEETFPGAVAFYANGAQGDQAPAGAEGADEFARIEDYGNRLAQEAAGLVRAIETKPVDRIGFSWGNPGLPEIGFSESASAGPYARLAAQAREALPRNAELQVFCIGRTVLAALPGEPVCAVGTSVRDAVLSAGFDDVLVLGLANDYLGYLLDSREYSHGGYEVDQRSFYGPGLGDFLVEGIKRLCAALPPP